MRRDANAIGNDRKSAVETEARGKVPLWRRAGPIASPNPGPARSQGLPDRPDPWTSGPLDETSRWAWAPRRGGLARAAANSAPIPMGPSANQGA